MGEVHGLEWLIVAAAAFLVGISKTGLPGLGLLAVVTLTFAVPAKESTGMLLLMLVAGDTMAVITWRRHAVWKHLIALSPPAAVGVIVGFQFMGMINDRQLAVIIGVVVVTLLALNRVRGWVVVGELHLPARWWIAWPIGIVAGVTTALANAAGPIIVLYFLAMRLDKHEFIGTGAWYFLMLNVFKVPFSAGQGLIDWTTVGIDALMLPVILAGAAAGVFIFKKLPQKTFVIVVELLALTAAIKLLLPPGALSRVAELWR